MKPGLPTHYSGLLRLLVQNVSVSDAGQGRYKESALNALCMRPNCDHLIIIAGLASRL